MTMQPCYILRFSAFHIHFFKPDTANLNICFLTSWPFVKKTRASFWNTWMLKLTPDSLARNGTPQILKERVFFLILQQVVCCQSISIPTKYLYYSHKTQNWKFQSWLHCSKGKNLELRLGFYKVKHGKININRHL